jgi:hypothetical protein
MMAASAAAEERVWAAKADASNAAGSAMESVGVFISVAKLLRTKCGPLLSIIGSLRLAQPEWPEASGCKKLRAMRAPARRLPML